VAIARVISWGGGSGASSSCTAADCSPAKHTTQALMYKHVLQQGMVVSLPLGKGSLLRALKVDSSGCQ
jgi:hypothetical protein